MLAFLSHLHLELYFSHNIDECTSGNDTCHINATCINTVGSYDCECLSGFMGGGFNCSSECVSSFACILILGDI